jgi:hypothetical protein
MLVMTPDGQIIAAGTIRQAEKICQNWFKVNLPSGVPVGIGEIEWRGDCAVREGKAVQS